MKPLYFILQLLLLTIAAYLVTGLAYQQLFPWQAPAMTRCRSTRSKPVDPALPDPAGPRKDYTHDHPEKPVSSPYP
jgi:hypothetical protein